MKTYEFKNCLKNGMFMQPVNNICMASYSSNEFDINTKHLFMPKSKSKNQSGDDNSYFQFDRVLSASSQ